MNTSGLFNAYCAWLLRMIFLQCMNETWEEPDNAYLVYKVWNEGDCFDVVETVRVVGQGRESFVQIIKSPKQDRRVRLEEPEGGPLEDQVEVGDQTFEVGIDVGRQRLDGLQVLLEVVVEHLDGQSSENFLKKT